MMDDINSSHAIDHTTFMAQLNEAPEKVEDDLNSAHAKHHTTFYS